jgi:hypothetical protein
VRKVRGERPDEPEAFEPEEHEPEDEYEPDEEYDPDEYEAEEYEPEEEYEGDEYEPEPEEDDEPEEVEPKKKKSAARTKEPAPAGASFFSRSQTRIEPWELYGAYILGSLTIVLALAGWIPTAIDDPRWQYIVAAPLGVLIGTLLIFAARSGRRFLTGFAALLTEFAQPPWRLASFVQLAAVVFGGLIIFRTSNEAAKRAGEERRRRREEERQAQASGRPMPARRGRGATAATTGPGRPAASKRYTPPKPKPKKRPTAPASKRTEETS